MAVPGRALSKSNPKVSVRHLNLTEIQTVRGLAVPDRLKQCGVAYSVAMTYLPVLCDMAEAYVKARAMSGQRPRYTLVHDPSKGWGVMGSDGFILHLGDDRKDECMKMMERLNA